MLQDRRSLKDLGDSSGSTGRAVAEGPQSSTDGHAADRRDGRVELARLRRRLRVRQEELESLQRRLSEIEDSQAWRTILRVRPLIQVFAPPGSLRRRVILRILSWGYSILGARPTRILTAPLRWPKRVVRRLRRPRSRSKRSAGR